MKSANISLMIDSICKELGISYESKNPHYQTFVDDAIKLGCIYRDLKIMIGEIHDIEIRHGINGIKEKLEEIIKVLDETDHQIIRLAKQLKENVD
jgi:hypothetical protein